MANVPGPGFPPPPRPALSGGVKVLLVVGCLGFLLLILCCGGLTALLSLRAVKVADTNEIRDASRVKAIARELADTDLIEDFEPEFAAHVYVPTFPYASTPTATIARLTGKHDRRLIIGEFQRESSAGKKPQELIDDVAQRGRHSGDLDVTPDETASDIQVKAITVRDKPAQFEFRKAKHKPVDGVQQEYWYVAGMFEGLRGPVVIILFAPRTDYTFDQLVDDFVSIK